MLSTTPRIRFKITRERALDTGAMVWGADPIDAPISGGVSGRTLAEIEEEVEAVKHFVLDLPDDVPVIVDYVLELPGISADEFKALIKDAPLLSRRLREAGLSEEDIARLHSPGHLAQSLVHSA